MVAILKEVILIALVSVLVTQRVSAGQSQPSRSPENPSFSSPTRAAHSPPASGHFAPDWTSAPNLGFDPLLAVTFSEKTARAQPSLPADFFENEAILTDVSSSSSAETPAPSITTFFKINAPLVPINNPPQLDPNKGSPLVITPEPGAFWSAGLCLFVLCALRRLSTWKKSWRKPLPE